MMNFVFLMIGLVVGACLGVLVFALMRAADVEDGE